MAFEVVKDGDRELAIIVRQGPLEKKYNFPTAPESSLQMGVNRYEAGERVKPHVHREPAGGVTESQEFLLVSEGEIELALYREDGALVATRTLVAGEAVLLLRGGHGIVFKQPTRIVEIKQGPYRSRELDKREL